MSKQTLPSGRFVGRAEWFDEAGDKGGYDVVMSLRGGEEAFSVTVKHVFDNGDPDTDATFDMSFVASRLFSVSAGGHVVGKGYMVDGFCHYAMVFGENVVETNLSWQGADLSVFGSATKNAAGRHIAWEEHLRPENSADDN